MSIKQIAEGFWNLAKKELLGIHNGEVEVLAIERYAICLACDDNKSNRCKHCGCYLPSMVRVKNKKCGHPTNKKW